MVYGATVEVGAPDELVKLLVLADRLLISLSLYIYTHKILYISYVCIYIYI